MVYYIFNRLLLIITPLIYSLLCKCGFYNIKFTKMPPALTTFTTTVIILMMGKIISSQLLCSLSKQPILLFSFCFISFHIMPLRSFLITRLGLNSISGIRISLSQRFLESISNTKGFRPSFIEKHFQYTILLNIISIHKFIILKLSLSPYLQLLMIDSKTYYYLINKANGKALSCKYTKDISKQNVSLNDISNESLQQIWMLKKTSFENTYYLAHCLTGLVIEYTSGKDLELHHMHEKTSQYFIISKSYIQNEQMSIQQYNQPTNIICFDKTIACKKTELTVLQAIWTLKRVVKNQIINGSCILSCQYSGYVMQAPGINQEKEGKSVQKSSWQGFFNQRWQIKRVNAFYTIRNIKNKRFVSLNQKKIKENNEVILTSQNNSFHFQLWSLEERGFNIFSIKTAYHEELYIGSKDHNLNEGSELKLVKNEFKNLWKVIGIF